MYLKRAADRALQDLLSGDKVGVILGARQVGKTTLVEHGLAGTPAVFLNFDVEVDKARFRAAAALSPGDGLRALGNPPVLVIDEAQRLPETSRIIKGWHDARLPAKFLLLGSSSLDLPIKRRRASRAATASWCCHRCGFPKRWGRRFGPTLTPPPARCVSISRRNCGPS